MINFCVLISYIVINVKMNFCVLRIYVVHTIVHLFSPAWCLIWDFKIKDRERVGVVVELRTPNREVLGSNPTGVAALCP